MADNNESTMKWKLDIAQFKASITDAKRQISLANAEFKQATGGAKDWADSITGVEAKIKQLSSTSESQNRILADLEGQYRTVSAEMGEASPQAQRLAVQIERQKASIAQTETQLSAYNGRLSDLKAQQAEAESPMGKLNGTISEQEDKLASLKNEYANATLQYGKNSTEAQKLAGEITSLSGELQENKSAVNGAKGAADQFDQSLDNVDESADSAASGGISALEVALGNLISSGLQKVVGHIQDLAGEAIDSSDALYKFGQTMSFAGYDSSAIETAKSDMKDYADRTVYDLNTVANTTAQLAANGIDNYEGLTEAAGNLNAVAGGNADTFQSVAMVMTQTAGAGKLTTENWNQLADAIPGASGRLQEALLNAGAYTGNFREAMEKGEITADEFNAAIMEIGNEPVAVEAAQSVDTFEGAVGNMQAAVVDGLMKIIDAIGMENITGFINTVTEGIEDMIPYIQTAVDWVMDNKDAIIAALAGIAAGITAMTVVQKVQGMVAAFQAWKTATDGMTLSQRLLNEAQMANPIGIIIGLIAAAVAALITLYMTNEDFRNKVNEIWANIQEFVGGVIQAIVGFFTETIPGGIQAMLTWFQQLPGEIGGFIGSVLTNVAAWASNMASQAFSAGSMFLSNVTQFITQLPGRVASYLGDVISRLASWVGQMGAKGREAASNLFNAVVNGISSLPGRMASIGSNIVSGIWSGISDGLGWIKGKIEGWVGNVTDFIKGLFGIHSPSKLMRDEIGKFLPEGIAVGFEDQLPKSMRKIKGELSASVAGLKESVAGSAASINGTVGVAARGSVSTGGQTIIFNQTNNSPKALSALDVYRQTNSLLFSAKVGLSNV